MAALIVLAVCALGLALVEFANRRWFRHRPSGYEQLLRSPLGMAFVVLCIGVAALSFALSILD